MTTRIFAEKKASGFLTTTSKPSRQVSIIFFLLAAKKYFLSVEHFSQKQTSVQNTPCFSPLLFFPMDLFFLSPRKTFANHRGSV